MENIPKNVTDIKAKEFLLTKLDDFIIKKIVNSEEFLLDHAIKLLKDVKTVMVYSFSSIVYKMLVEAHKQGYRFKVIVVDDPSNNFARVSCGKLNEQGIEVIYT